MSEFWVFEAELNEKQSEHLEKQWGNQENKRLTNGRILPFRLNFPGQNVINVKKLKVISLTKNV